MENIENVHFTACSGFSEDKGLGEVLSLEGSYNLVSVVLIEGFSFIYCSAVTTGAPNSKYDLWHRRVILPTIRTLWGENDFFL